MYDVGDERQPAKQVIVDEHHEGQRIDNFLGHCLKGVPKQRIYRCLRRGEVRVNRGRIRQGYRLRCGDVVRIPPLRYSTRTVAGTPGQWLLKRLQDAVIYEDAHVLALNKPAGIAVHGGTAKHYGVIEGLRAARVGAPFLELVHRLDRDTSGCLLVAKKRSALTALHALLRNNQLTKRYLMLVRGEWRSGAMTVDQSLRRNVLSSGERVVRPSPDGKTAITRFRVLHTTGVASLMEARLVTGRTHQIRVHAASIGHPIAGDEKYGDREFNKRMRRLGLRRMFLHASSVSFRAPYTDGRLDLEAPAPSELLEMAERVGFSKMPR